jgi:hypothetical protein
MNTMTLGDLLLLSMTNILDGNSACGGQVS